MVVVLVVAVCVLECRCPGRAVDEFVIMCPNGIITYYPKKDTFVADCDMHGRNPKCCRTRTAREAINKKGPQGRPLGFLYAFLKHHGGPDITTPGQHYELSKGLSFDVRRQARAELAALAGVQQLLSMERAARPDEGPEPADSVA